jgi:hypothetical protein
MKTLTPDQESNFRASPLNTHLRLSTCNYFMNYGIKESLPTEPAGSIDQTLQLSHEITGLWKVTEKTKFW